MAKVTTKKPSPKSLEARRPEIIESLTFDLANPNRTEPRTKLAQKYGVKDTDIYNFERRNKQAIRELSEQILASDWDNVGEYYKTLALLAITQAKAALPKATAKEAALVAQIATDKVLALENKGQIKELHLHNHTGEVGNILVLLAGELQKRGIGGELHGTMQKLLESSNQGTESAPKSHTEDGKGGEGPPGGEDLT